MQLYRPVGLIKLQRIYESGMQAFPPRLPEQPIFYPVLNFIILLEEKEQVLKAIATVWQRAYPSISLPKGSIT
jgi:hypothetical protein